MKGKVASGDFREVDSLTVSTEACRNRRWRILAGVFGMSLVTIVAACSADSPTDVESASKQVSEVGSVVEVHTFADGSYTEYLYRRVHFLGDIALSEYNQALELSSSPRQAVRVANYREFPPSALDREDGDSFQIFFCVGDGVRDCANGVRDRFYVEDGAVVRGGGGFW